METNTASLKAWPRSVFAPGELLTADRRLADFRIELAEQFRGGTGEDGFGRAGEDFCAGIFFSGAFPESIQFAAVGLDDGPRRGGPVRRVFAVFPFAAAASEMSDGEISDEDEFRLGREVFGGPAHRVVVSAGQIVAAGEEP